MTPRYARTASQILWTLLLFGYRTAVKLMLIIALKIVHLNPTFTTPRGT